MKILPLISSLFLAAGAASAATIVTNNTGLDNSAFSFIDWNPNVGDLNVGNAGTISSSGLGGFTQGSDVNSFGGSYYQATIAGTATFTFTGLTPNQTYNIYGTWFGDGSSSGITLNANGVSVSTAINQNVAPVATGNGFTAYQNATEAPLANDDPISETKAFQFLGTGITNGAGQLVLTSTKETGKTNARWDAFAVAPVPEPSAGLLGGLGALALLRRRRA